MEGVNVFQYLNQFTPQQRVDFFLKTQSPLYHQADYWTNFKKVNAEIENIGPDLYTLDWLIGRSEDEVKYFFVERPHLLKLMIHLLGIRSQSHLMHNVLTVQTLTGLYSLDFANIDVQKIDNYMKFMRDSGLLSMLQEGGINKSIRDYVTGVEVGMDSNGRKNRSGKEGEEFLRDRLVDLAKKKGWEYHGQSTSKNIETWYGIKLDNVFHNRQFDASMYNPEKMKLYLFEVNKFDGKGSKSKASGTEFQQLMERFNRTSHEFIYVTNGNGWERDKSHLLEAMTYIGKVFNFRMLEEDWLEEYLS